MKANALLVSMIKSKAITRNSSYTLVLYLFANFQYSAILVIFFFSAIANDFILS